MHLKNYLIGGGIVIGICLILNPTVTMATITIGIYALLTIMPLLR